MIGSSANLATILIGSSTALDEDLDTLQDIIDEWSSTADDFNTRIDSLLTIVDESSLFDDGRNDTLFGDGGLDWFLVGAKDKARDKSPNDRVN